jgi:fumarylacetoacetase
MTRLDHTHDHSARSWIRTANDPTTDFPIQNLPFSVFKRRSSQETFRGGIAIGDQIVDLAALRSLNAVTGPAAEALDACAGPTLNRLLELGRPAWKALRHAIFDLLDERAATSFSDPVGACLVPQRHAEYAVPVRIGNYSDFYTSFYHATNIGKMFGIATEGTNFEWLPIAYHGRASSIGISGQRFNRPVSQTKRPGETVPALRATEKLDYELELAIYIGKGNQLGTSIELNDVEDHVFGIGLLNDWSARDIQAWEMQPLGPFLAKSFATTISPWIVTLDALAPFRSEFKRPSNAPPLLGYLDSVTHAEDGAFDINLEVLLDSTSHREMGVGPTRLSQTSFRHQYWTIAQMVAHQTINGCNLQAGDVLGSGTISGPNVEEAGAMMELASNGSKPVMLSTGEKRSFIEDGDTVILRGSCEKLGFARIGLGESRGEVLPARERSAK